MFTPENIASIAKSIKSLMVMDEEVNNFYKLLKEKNIEPKSLADLERITRFFDATYDKVVKDIKNDEAIQDEFKKVVIARFTLDMFGKIAETFSLDFTQVPFYLGSHNQKRFLEAQKDIMN